MILNKRKKNKEGERVLDLSVSKLIDSRFREYAVYVLEQRGIPSFYGALTPVQRYILMNTPNRYVKTLSVVGKSIEDGYHHGNSSLEKAIAKLARPFGSSNQILDGYGFFGTEVSPDPAAARYTSVRLSKNTDSILGEYRHLTTKKEDAPYDPLWTSVPLGLTTSIVGIAVGYKTTVLPRKELDIRKYLNGETDRIKPHFTNFTGTIRQYKQLPNAWIITSKFSTGDRRLGVDGLPPVSKYSSVLKKVNDLLLGHEGLSLIHI